MVLSLIIAFLTWLFVAQSSKDIKGRTIQNVSVDMQNVDESIGKLGLTTISVEQAKVSVYVEGVLYNVGNLKAEDIVIYPDISKITTAGIYSVELRADIRDKTTNENVSVISMSPQTLQMKFDSLETKTLTIRNALSNISAPGDYLIGNVSLNPSVVNITGPEADISKVYECVAEKRVSGELTSTYSETISLKFLDKERNELDIKYITPDVTETRVTIPVYKKKTVPVFLNYLNVPDSFPAHLLKFNISPAEIEVAGPEEQIDQYMGIALGYIDIKSLSLNTSKSFAVKLPSGFTNTKNIQNVLVTFNSEGMIKKSFDIPNENIHAENVPFNYEVTATGDKISQVEIIGPKDIVESLLPGDIVATVDLQENFSIESGQVELPVKISVPSKGLAWARGDYKAIFSILDRSTLSEEELEELDAKKAEEVAAKAAADTATDAPADTPATDTAEKEEPKT